MPTPGADASLPLCFVAMPFGTKKHPEIIEPAVLAANMAPLRADEERLGGIIHKPMFERLVLSDFVLADLTTANANVFYELGVRHAVRPFTTVVISAAGHRLPFDVAPTRA